MKRALTIYEETLKGIGNSGLYKDERILVTPQRARIDTTKVKGVLNMCANNYLGLSSHPAPDCCCEKQL